MIKYTYLNKKGNYLQLKANCGILNFGNNVYGKSIIYMYRNYFDFRIILSILLWCINVLG